MGKKYVIMVFLIGIIVSTCAIVPVYAEEDNGDENTTNLGLDTEILKNKKEESNSTSTTGENELFSSDYNTIILDETEKEKDYYSSLNGSVFNGVENEASIPSEKSENKVFEEKVSFDKLSVDSNESDNDNYFAIAIIAIICLVSTYVITRKRYARTVKDGDDDANNDYVYK